jgi:hypothetical protein
VDIQKITSPRDLEFVTERIDLFRFEPPDEVQPYTGLSWCAHPGGGYRPPGGFDRLIAWCVVKRRKGWPSRG